MGSPQPKVVELFPARVTVKIEHIANKGRGVVAARRIAKGELIETAPVVVVARADRAHVERTVLDHYVYDWSHDALAVALGAGSLFNHSYTPNALYVKRFDDNALEYFAIADIEAGDEITINYNGTPTDLTPLWFDVVD
jgi:SET domain-containing protein